MSDEELQRRLTDLVDDHSPPDAPPFDMQVGLLGRDLYLNDSTRNIVPPPQPTPVPLPAPVQ